MGTRKPPPPGVWEEYAIGPEHKTWTLRLGSVFQGQVTRTGGFYYSTVNGMALPVKGNLEDAKWQCEREIIAAVRDMLPAYKVVLDRQRMMTGTVGFSGPNPEKE